MLDASLISFRLSFRRSFLACLQVSTIIASSICSFSALAGAHEIRQAAAKSVARLELGVDRFDDYASMLSQQRVGLVVNQASVTSEHQHTIDFLLKKGINIVKLFALEHGVRGAGGAGEEIPDSVDEVSGLPIVSLYGKSKKPSAAQLSDVDVVVYDIQDVGVRFYTYISSLGLIMEAAAQNQKQVIVLDRPNPNGDYVGGPVLKVENKSFVGAFPIPIVYGMTVGELAQMIHGKGWQKTDGLDLRIVAMKNYHRESVYEPPVWPSSGLKNLKAIRLYPSIALFEPTVMSFGGGTDHPYLQYGYPDSRVGNHSFVPMPKRPKHKPRHEGQICYGEKFYDLEIKDIPRFSTDLFSRALAKTPVSKFVTDQRFLELLVGDRQVVREMLRGVPYRLIKKRLRPEIERFKNEQRPYLIYPVSK